MNTKKIKLEEHRTEEIGNLIADAVLGKMSRQTAKEGSSFDRQRKLIIKGVLDHTIYDKIILSGDDMYRIFIAGMEWNNNLKTD